MCVYKGEHSFSFSFGCISLRTAVALVSNKKLQLKKIKKNESNYKNKKIKKKPKKIEWVTHRTQQVCIFPAVHFSSFPAALMRAIRVIPNGFDTTFPLYADIIYIYIKYKPRRNSFMRQWIFFVSINETSKLFSGFFVFLFFFFVFFLAFGFCFLFFFCSCIYQSALSIVYIRDDHPNISWWHAKMRDRLLDWPGATQPQSRHGTRLGDDLYDSISILFSLLQQYTLQFFSFFLDPSLFFVLCYD